MTNPVTNPIITRFAPSPTGFLHIGGARTALFNYLFAKHHAEYGDGGKFCLRVEDTDLNRSTDEAKQAIVAAMNWLNLNWDDDIVYQSDNLKRHQEVAEQLLDAGHAYKCYVSKAELEAMRRAGTGYDRRWRERASSEAPDDPDADYTIRIKAPMGKSMTIDDHIQSQVTIDHDQLDDFILLRADGTPTYMLSVVVDDHDMDITHVIRGDDHLMNAFRQRIIYEAMGWTVPEFAHVPLIHGSDSKKLSKRHGALGVMEYKKMGYLPEALNNYLLRLGWSHGDDEIISQSQAIEWFNLEHIGQSPSQFDMDKLNFINRHYLEAADDDRLTDLTLNFLRDQKDGPIRDFQVSRLHMAMGDLKTRNDTLVELADDAYFLIAERPLEMTEQAKEVLDPDTIDLLNKLADKFDKFEGDDFDPDTVKIILNTFTDEQDIGLGKIGQPLRAALTGSVQAPGIFDIPAWLGRQESIARIRDLAA